MEATVLSSTTGSERAAARPQRRTDLSRVSSAVLVVLFLVGIFAPLVGVRIGGHGWDIGARAENRRMAQLPELLRAEGGRAGSGKARLRAVAHFPGEFKYYLSDHFGFRSLLIRAHGLLMVEGLGVTSNHAVTLGKEGWLYLANDKSTEDWRNVEPFTESELGQWRAMLEERHNYCAGRGIPYLFVVAPSKYDVYPEYMPDRLTRVGADCRLDQLKAYLKRGGSPVTVVDLREPLLAARDHGDVRLYQKTDTHWNDRGAWIGYAAMMAAVRARVPGATPLPLSDFEAVTAIRPGMDLAGLLGLNDVLTEESLDLRAKRRMRLPHVEQNDVEPITVDGPGPRVVMFRDSFMTAALPFVAESFGRGVYLWEDGFDREVVSAERPDVVIQQIAQRKLMQPVEKLGVIQPVKRVEGKWMFAK